MASCGAESPKLLVRRDRDTTRESFKGASRLTEDLYDRLKERIDAVSIAVKMHEREAPSLKEHEYVLSKRSRLIEAAETLLNILSDQPDKHEETFEYRTETHDGTACGLQSDGAEVMRTCSTLNQGNGSSLPLAFFIVRNSGVRRLSTVIADTTYDRLYTRSLLGSTFDIYDGSPVLRILASKRSRVILLMYAFGDEMIRINVPELMWRLWRTRAPVPGLSKSESKSNFTELVRDDKSLERQADLTLRASGELVLNGKNKATRVMVRYPDLIHYFHGLVGLDDAGWFVDGEELKHFVQPDYGLLDHLLSAGVLSFAEHNVIRHQADVNRRCELLLVKLRDLKRDQRSSFIIALRQTGQQHVVNYMSRHRDASVCGDMWPLCEELRSKIERTTAPVAAHLDLRDGFLDELLATGAITRMQRNDLLDHADRNLRLLDIVRRGSVHTFNKFINLLHDKNQAQLAQVILNTDHVEDLKSLFPKFLEQDQREVRCDEHEVRPNAGYHTNMKIPLPMQTGFGKSISVNTQPKRMATISVANAGGEQTSTAVTTKILENMSSKDCYEHRTTSCQEELYVEKQFGRRARFVLIDTPGIGDTRKKKKVPTATLR